MDMYIAHFIHPHTQVPLIIYFNKRDGYVTFEKDNEILKLLLQLEIGLTQDEDFLDNISQTSNICQTQYPVNSFDEVYQFLEQLGVQKDDLTFKQLFLH
ncbi:hypothetical protein [Alkalihalobacillus deserti]|uniref:hypothetical protein n=1 Tax=Alkalihalobacillus deserti TaxID=2879466 RepID=UPI001D139914|nr:hypothetical protein [Alkalihalobacillus deserti]